MFNFREKLLPSGRRRKRKSGFEEPTNGETDSGVSIAIHQVGGAKSDLIHTVREVADDVREAGCARVEVQHTDLPSQEVFCFISYK